jgi:hypothetical protein
MHGGVTRTHMALQPALQKAAKRRKNQLAYASEAHGVGAPAHQVPRVDDQMTRFFVIAFSRYPSN